MRLRVVAVAIAATFVTAPVATHAGESPPSESGASDGRDAEERAAKKKKREREKRAARKKAKAKAKAKARAKLARKKARRERAKRLAKEKRERAKKVANMPDGWAWPPTRAMRRAGKACKKEIAAMGIRHKRAAREGRIATPVYVPAMELGGVKLVSMYRKPPFTMDCELVRGLATHLPKLHAIGVREVHFSSIFRDTPVRVAGTTKAARSRHSLGLAIDVRAFVDDTGRKAVVETDYTAGDTLLLEVERALNDTGGFRTVLTPGNDPQSHYDHYHLEVRVEYPEVAARGSRR